MPSFLDLVFLFNRREAIPPQALFRSENRLEWDSLGRQATSEASSAQIQHTFSMISVVRGSTEDGNCQWKLSQTALYHAFDFYGGQALWLIMENHPSVHRRLDSASGRQPHLLPSNIASLEGSFIATLYVHLVVMESCADDWGGYIDCLEEREATARVGPMPFPIDTTASDSIVELTTQISEGSTAAEEKTAQGEKIDYGAQTRPVEPRCPVARRVGMTLANFQRVRSGFKKSESLYSPEYDPRSNMPRDMPHGPNTLVGRFSLAAYVDLDNLTRELEHAILAIEGNIGVVADIRAQYKCVTRSSGFQEFINGGRAEDTLAFFFGQLEDMEKGFRAGRSRLMAIRRSLQSEKNLVRYIYASGTTDCSANTDTSVQHSPPAQGHGRV